MKRGMGRNAEPARRFGALGPNTEPCDEVWRRYPSHPRSGSIDAVAIG